MPATRKAVIFSSLPKVGGHSTVTLTLAALFRNHFDAVEVWSRTMPGHGHSADAERALRASGVSVRRLASASGSLQPGALAAAVGSALRNPPELFFTVGMRHLSPFLARATRARASFYYQISHDLTPATVRLLRAYARAFSKIVFVCPATYEDFLERDGRFTWVPHLSEIPVVDREAMLGERSAEGPFRFGLLGRLTPEKGAAAMLEFARSTRTACELHVAGDGPLAGAFASMSRESRGGCRVVFHGRYSPAERGVFLRKFFRTVDCTVVPTQDEWETLSLAVLEGLQHGVPSIVCRTGGLRSFEHPELGGPRPEEIRLVPRDGLGDCLETAAREGRMMFAGGAACLAHYERFFSNDAVSGRWTALLNETRVSAERERR